MQARPAGGSGIWRLCAVIGAAAVAACGTAGLGCGDFGVGPCGPPVKIEVAIDVVAADFNGDGRPDVALPVDEGAGTPGVVAVYQHGSASGRGYLPRADYPAGVTFPTRILAADLDGDGRPDLILLTSESASSTVAVLLNDPGNPGSFGPPQLLSAPFANDVAVADLNGDGRPDLVIAGSTLMVAPQNAAPGTFAAPTTLYSGNGAGFVAVAVGDLDGDGSPDVAVADELGVIVLSLVRGAATPTVARATRVYGNAAPGPNTGQNAVAIADVDGDGRNDLVVVDPVNSEVAVILQSHTTPGQFLPPLRYPLPAGNDGLNRLVVTDLNGRGGLPAIVIAAGDAVLVYLPNPARPGTFGAAASYPVPIGADGVSVADVDGDGLPDIVINSGVTVASFGALPAPGMLYQDPANPGHFLAVQDLQM